MSDWATAIAQAAAELNKAFGAAVQIGSSTITARVAPVQVDFSEVPTGTQKVYARQLTIDLAVMAQPLARGAVVTVGGRTYRVREMTHEDEASRSYLIVQ